MRIQAYILIFFLLCLGLKAQKYQKSWWFQGGMTTDFTKLGEAASLNFGLDDKFFSIGYEHFRYSGNHHGERSNLQKYQYNIMSGRVWQLFDNFSLGFSGGFGFQVYSYTDDYDGSDHRLNGASIPLRILVNYRINDHLGVYSRYHYTHLGVLASEGVSQLQLGLRVGWLPELETTKVRFQQAQQKCIIMAGAGLIRDNLTANTMFGYSLSRHFALQARALFQLNNGAEYHREEVNNMNLLSFNPSVQIGQGKLFGRLGPQFGYGELSRSLFESNSGNQILMATQYSSGFLYYIRQNQK